MSNRKSAKKAEQVPVPQSDADAEGCIHRLGESLRMVAKLEADRDTALAALTMEWANKLSPHADDVTRMGKGLAIYYTTHRARLTADGKTKTLKLPTGSVEWRNRPPSVRLRGGVEKIIERIKELKLRRFLRISVDVNKQAMLDDPDAARRITGVRIVAGEDMAIRPIGAEREVVESV